MSTDERDIGDGDRNGASRLLARAAAALSRADRGLAQTIDDFFLPEDARLDDRTRATLTVTLAAMVAAVEGDLRRRAARSLAAAGEGVAVLDRLTGAGLLRDPGLMRELIARTRLDLLADALTTAAPDDAGAPSLLARLTASGDGQVANAALTLMATEGRRRGFLDTGRLSHTELPAELHHRLVWWVAAAILEQLADGDAGRVMADAGLHALGGHDESDRAETAAVRLATTIDPQPAELPALLTHALGDRNLSLFVALLAFALRMDFAVARQLVVAGGDPLWLALRAIDLDRATIARIGLALSNDVDAFADQLDAIVAVSPADARAALSSLALPADLRAAIAALAAAR
ncbi:DUF2336 domain-containing protein [Sphingomonas panacisoli]|uniref:DUF2336 domain-containing protein n=1 Tax=Sphingomonas panacisoli TaxID=1813879 RepID=A0A5B8LHV9_9SPHN|nr:DUF2336 domain-containing protein [Sphingomonas panacisoli]QDZ07212.1 DUF2336 domain-containing protein [Sphingomonas panacisoli]